MSIADVIYLLCSITSMACAILLLRGFAHSRVRMLLWSGVCFVFLGLNNILLVIDLTFTPSEDLSAIRSIPTIIGLGLLLYGFIWEEKTLK